MAAAPQAGPGLAPFARPAGYVNDLASVFSDEDRR